jgi:monoterpene epsilon-lactone hydrolase
LQPKVSCGTSWLLDDRAMTSPQTSTAIETIARDRARAGLTNELLDPRASRASLPPTALAMPPGTTVTYEAVGTLGLFWVRAEGASDVHRLVYAHGGGFVTGGFHSHRSLVGWLSLASGATVVFPEYRLAPESRFPAALDDVQLALERAAAVGPYGKASPAQTLWVGGDSAGATLMLGAMLRLRDAGKRLPSAGALFCGMLDLDDARSEFLQSSQRSRDQVRAYLASMAQLHDPHAAPMTAQLAGLPPLLLQTASEDLCRHDSQRFAELASAQGVAVHVDEWTGMFHVWHRFAPELPEAVAALEAAASFLRRYP